MTSSLLLLLFWANCLAYKGQICLTPHHTSFSLFTDLLCCYSRSGVSAQRTGSEPRLSIEKRNRKIIQQYTNKNVEMFQPNSAVQVVSQWHRDHLRQQRWVQVREFRKDVDVQCNPRQGWKIRLSIFVSSGHRPHLQRYRRRYF